LRTREIKAPAASHRRLDSLSEDAPDVAATTFLAPHGRWNGLISAVGSYVSGAELERVSARDFQRYDDSGVNWRVVDGYGAVIAAHGERLPVLLGSPAQRIDHRGHRLRGHGGRHRHCRGRHHHAAERAFWIADLEGV
jgi:monoamine oxidase